jgi:hypothetical protein
MLDLTYSFTTFLTTKNFTKKISPLWLTNPYPTLVGPLPFIKGHTLDAFRLSSLRKEEGILLNSRRKVDLLARQTESSVDT